MKRKKFAWVFLCGFFFLTSLHAFDSLYLTYPGDPAHSIAVHWLEEKEGVKDQKVLYRKLQEEKWQSVSSSEEKFGKNLLKRCLIIELESDTDYEFSLEKEPSIYRFRTLPKSLDHNLKIAIGGDAYQKAAPFKEMNEVVATLAPDFVILGGDLAYANQGNPVKRWKAFLRIWYETMKTKDGRIIPLVAAVGNHEMLSKAKGGGELFLKLFPYLQKGSYGTLDLTDSISFILLDTGHINPILGEQTDWLKQTLESKKEYLYKFAVYHIAAYPSIYPYGGETPTLLRDTWCPLFDENKVNLAFENHNHAFKRTFFLKAGKVDKTGVVYIGDGTWSVPPRSKRGARWYLEKLESSSCVSLMTLTRESIKVETFDHKGKMVDEWNTEVKDLGKKERD